MQQTLHTYHEPAPYGGLRLHAINLRGDEYLALVAALDDKQAIIRRQLAERDDMQDGADTFARLDMLARHRCELREIADRINSIKAMGA